MKHTERKHVFIFTSTVLVGWLSTIIGYAVSVSSVAADHKNTAAQAAQMAADLAPYASIPDIKEQITRLNEKVAHCNEEAASYTNLSHLGIAASVLVGVLTIAYLIGMGARLLKDRGQESTEESRHLFEDSASARGRASTHGSINGDGAAPAPAGRLIASSSIQ
jgi:hypothetical protein